MRKARYVTVHRALDLRQFCFRSNLSCWLFYIEILKIFCTTLYAWARMYYKTAQFDQNKISHLVVPHLGQVWQLSILTQCTWCRKRYNRLHLQMSDLSPDPSGSLPPFPSVVTVLIIGQEMWLSQKSKSLFAVPCSNEKVSVDRGVGSTNKTICELPLKWTLSLFYMYKLTCWSSSYLDHYTLGQDLSFKYLCICEIRQ